MNGEEKAKEENDDRKIKDDKCEEDGERKRKQ